MSSLEKEINISFLLKEILVKDVMASVLDLARISDMGDRQFEQFEKNIKDKIYSLIKNNNDLLLTCNKFKTSETNDVLPRLGGKTDN